MSMFVVDNHTACWHFSMKGPSSSDNKVDQTYPSCVTHCVYSLQSGREISAIIVTVDYLCYLISLSKFNLPLIGSFYVTHAARALHSHDLAGRELNCGSQTYFFDHTRTWRASPDELSARCRGHLRDSTNMKDNTHQAHIHSYQQGEY